MPAATADTLTLPRIARPLGPGRAVARVVDARRAVEGDGFVVRRPFPGVLSLADADPFLLLDHMGAADHAPGEAKGTPWHPHRGFETVTYLVDGQLEHQDSTGGGGVITDGATQWMTAGDGILHVERPTELLVTRGGRMHGVQLWVNLPRSHKRTAPRYQGIEAGEVTLLSSDDGGALVRLIAGDLDGHRGPGSTHTPITYAHATLAPGARLVVPWTPGFNAFAYVLNGDGSAGREGWPVHEAQLVVFDGDVDGALELAAGPSADLDVLLLGGRPIREPIAHYGPFVMNTKAEILEAIEDFQAGRLGRNPASS
jgi:redox-sensitive bicupin YhaK (pirin superfamily)